MSNKAFSAEEVPSAITLRRLRATDGEAMADLLMHKAIRNTFMVPDYQSRQEALRAFAGLYERSEGDILYIRAICRQDRLIGFVLEAGYEADTLEIGYVIHPDHQGHGYATQGVKLALSELAESGIVRVKAGFFEGNHPSRRVMEKCGMTPTGETKTFCHQEQMQRCIYYGKALNEED